MPVCAIYRRGPHANPPRHNLDAAFSFVFTKKSLGTKLGSEVRLCTGRAGGTEAAERRPGLRSSPRALCPSAPTARTSQGCPSRTRPGRIRRTAQRGALPSKCRLCLAASHRPSLFSFFLPPHFPPPFVSLLFLFFPSFPPFRSPLFPPHPVPHSSGSSSSHRSEVVLLRQAPRG